MTIKHIIKLLSFSILAGIVTSFGGGELALAKGVTLAVCLTSAIIIITKYIADTKFDGLLFCSFFGGISAIPCSILTYFLLPTPPPEVPLFVYLSAPVLYGILFTLGMSIYHRYKLNVFWGYNIVLILMYIGAFYRLYPLFTDPQTVNYDLIGILVTAAPFTT
ncbi:MAG: hypothetical protein GY750_16510 [Lentisphaerae bacterium]|nr:hypothetical protein [Lentisphaerota bacterium]MCP4102999.1 hypothetical protein [Lentisphaerota bacterium]